MGIDSYQVTKDISKCKTNLERGNYVVGVMRDVAGDLDRKVEVQKIRGPLLNTKYGKDNYILRSGVENPFLLVAHYDAFLLEGKMVPGANDNGSGVGVCLEALVGLKDLPVDVVLFAGEEDCMFGSMDYCDRMYEYENPSGVCCLDMVGVGDRFVVPRVSEWGNKKFSTDKFLNRVLISAASDMGFDVGRNFLYSGSDHFSFLRYGIPASMVTVQDFESNLYKMIHSKSDTMKNIERDTLKTVSDIVVSAVGSYCEFEYGANFADISSAQNLLV